MAKLGITLKVLLETAGISTADPRYTDLIALDTEIPEEAQDALYQNLYNEFGVKNNDKFSKHFKKEIYDGLDARLEATARKFKFTDAELAELKKTNNSFERAEKIVTILNEKSNAVVEAAKEGSSSTAKALQEEISRLSSQVTAAQQKFEDEKKELLSSFKEKQKNSLIDNFLSGKSYDREDVPKSVHLITAKTLLNEKLKEKGAQLILTDDGNLKMVQASNPELAYTEQDREVAFTDYANRILADNKLLKVTDPKGSTGGNPVSNPVLTDPNLKPNTEGVELFRRQRLELESQQS